MMSTTVAPRLAVDDHSTRLPFPEVTGLPPGSAASTDQAPDGAAAEQLEDGGSSVGAGVGSPGGHDQAGSGSAGEDRLVVHDADRIGDSTQDTRRGGSPRVEGLGRTRSRQPCHPLDVPARTSLEVFRHTRHDWLDGQPIPDPGIAEWLYRTVLSNLWCRRGRRRRPSAGGVVVMVAAEVSSRTTAACSDCVWTSDALTDNLSVRVAARQHSDLTQHPVVVLTNTITVLQPGPVAVGFTTAVGAEAAALSMAPDRTWRS